jgi:hypothetical protein
MTTKQIQRASLHRRWHEIANSLWYSERFQKSALRGIDFRISQMLANWSPDMAPPYKMAQWHGPNVLPIFGEKS